MGRADQSQEEKRLLQAKEIRTRRNRQLKQFALQNPQFAKQLSNSPTAEAYLVQAERQASREAIKQKLQQVNQAAQLAADRSLSSGRSGNKSFTH